ncbi:MAG: DUF1826 domain-containing protein [Gammaproteobacteria bacterium]
MSDAALSSSQHGSSAHLFADESEVLGKINDSPTNLCVWRRSPQPALEQELSRLRADSLPDLRCSTSLASFDQSLRALFQSRGLDPAEFRHWIADMGLLAQHFFNVRPSLAVNVRLVTMDDVSCPRFHVDHSNLRLLCTYRGPGTEWLANDQVDRAAQASGASNEDMIRFGAPEQFQPFWVGIMKGSAYPGNSESGLVHRSPAVHGPDQMRVLFCLDS